MVKLSWLTGHRFLFILHTRKIEDHCLCLPSALQTHCSHRLLWGICYHWVRIRGLPSEKTKALKERMKEKSGRQVASKYPHQFLELKVENVLWIPSCSFQSCQKMVSGWHITGRRDNSDDQANGHFFVCHLFLLRPRHKLKQIPISWRNLLSLLETQGYDLTGNFPRTTPN